MQIHDWTGVDAGIFHDFHHAWIEEIKRALNRGILPPNYYAPAEQIAGGLGPDVLTLQSPFNSRQTPVSSSDAAAGVALADARPHVWLHAQTDSDVYAAKAKAIAIRHASSHEVVAIVEIVSPGNKNSRHGLRAFVDKAAELLQAGIHLLIAALFPPGPRDPQGIHKAIWDEFIDTDFTLPPETPLTFVAYIGGLSKEAFVQPACVGASPPDMPLFLTSERYVTLPLNATYQSAWDAVPAFWQAVLEGESD